MTDQQPTKTEKVKQTLKAEVEKIPPTTDRNLMAALSYIWVIGLVMLIMKHDDPFIAEHARQGVVLQILTLAAVIPVLGWIVFALACAGMVLGFINAWMGRAYKIPYVYRWSQWLNW